MKVLFATAEAEPFVKNKSIGNDIFLLSKALKSKKVEITIVMPKYADISIEFKEKLNFEKGFMVKVGWKKQYCGIFSSVVENIKYYFIDNEYYFRRNGLYGHLDDGERFSFFNIAVLEMLKELNYKPHIIQCYDWQSGMIPLLYKEVYLKNSDFYKGIKTIYSIDDVLNKGIFQWNIVKEIFLQGEETFPKENLEFYGGFSFVKAAISYADKIVNHMNKYEKSIYEEGLTSIFRKRQKDFERIEIGLDYEKYNPNKDELIYFKYSAKEVLHGKKENKIKLQEELSIEVDKKIPLILIMIKSKEDKEFSLKIIEHLVNMNIQLVVLMNDKELDKKTFSKFREEFKEKVSVNFSFDENLEHKCYAGCDILLDLSVEFSKMEEFKSMRYGTIPITIGKNENMLVCYDKEVNEGNSFICKEYNVYKVLDTINQVLTAYYNKSIWNGIAIRAMELDISLQKIVSKYLDLYERLIVS